MGLGGLLLVHGFLLFIAAEEISDWEGTPLPDRYDTTGKVKHGIEGEEAGEQRAWINIKTQTPKINCIQRISRCVEDT